MLRLLAAVMPGLAMLACGAGTVGSSDAGESAAVPAQQTVRYVLDWTALPLPGAKPRITQLTLRSWSLQLVACPQANRDLGWSLVPAAFADHGAPVEPSLWVAAATETLPKTTLPVPSPAKEVHGNPCELLWVVSAGTLASGAKPGDLAFSAVVRWADAAGDHTRTLATPVAHARKLPLGALPKGAAWTVRLVRSTDGALDGLDLAGGATESLAWAVLDRLVQSATVQVD